MAARAGNDTPKYLNSPETPFHKGRQLYGLYEALKIILNRNAC
ncbi:hypothetical protein [Pantoea sp. SGAir0180]